MPERVCPWWLGYFLISPLRRLRQNPKTILEPLVREGMLVLEPGPGMGFFTLELARLAGPTGRVVAVDIQDKMLRTLERRAQKAGLQERVETRLVQPNTLGVEDLAGKVDFVLAFAMVHEMPAADRFFKQAAAALKKGGTMLVSEPKAHVTPALFTDEMEAALMAGFKIISRPDIAMSLSAVLEKTA
jgi:ubiquinone/menaquinone biosynthesis C-methylase UbiE